MFTNLRSTLAGANSTEAKKVINPTLRSDIYSAIDNSKSWIIGGLGGGQAGDGVSVGPIVKTIQKHFPDVKIGMDSMGHADGEVAIVVGGIVNMILEMSKWDAMAAAMAMRTWVETLTEAYGRVPNTRPGGRKDLVARGITKGVNHNADVSLMTREFAARIQIISLLKTVSSKIHGVGSDEARQGEALWSSKFI